jgi:cytochrome c oxidase assembly protein subunit 15
LAWALALVIFPLIWVGGLVTTYDAGMAVPDWPTTYGYNLLLYPWTTWLGGPWDLLIEHGHRLLGALAGMISLALVALAWWKDRRPSVRWGAVAVALAVIIQGVIGGMRVQADSGRLAQVHGCTGPLVFSLAVLLVAFSAPPHCRRLPTPKRGAALAWTLAGAAYLQLVLGSFIRHVPAAQTPTSFRLLVVGHLAGAAAVTLLALVLLTRQTMRWSRPCAWLSPSIAALVLLQLVLGAGTWIAKYNWPAWAGGGERAGVVIAEGMGQSLVVTAHVANGSLILALSLLLAVRTTDFASFQRRIGIPARPGTRPRPVSSGPGPMRSREAALAAGWSESSDVPGGPAIMAETQTAAVPWEATA